MTTQIPQLSITTDVHAPAGQRGSDAPREALRRDEVSYNDQLAIVARRQGKLVGPGGIGAIPTEVPQSESAQAKHDPVGGTPRATDRATPATPRTPVQGPVDGGRGPEEASAGPRPARANAGSQREQTSPPTGDDRTGDAERRTGGAAGAPKPTGGSVLLAGLGGRASAGASAKAANTVMKAGGKPAAGVGEQRLRVRAARAPNRAESTKPATRDTLIEQIQRGLAKALQQKDGELTIRLRPEHLGMVRVRINVQDSRVTATIGTSNKQARDLLKQNIGTLERALEARGLSVDRVVVEHDTSHGLATDGEPRGSQEQRGGAAAGEDHGRSPGGPDAERPDNLQVLADPEWHAEGIHIDAIA